MQRFAVVKPQHQMTREERRRHHHVMRFDVESLVPSGARGFWSHAERRKRARRRARKTGGGRRLR